MSQSGLWTLSKAELHTIMIMPMYIHRQHIYMTSECRLAQYWITSMWSSVQDGLKSNSCRQDQTLNDLLSHKHLYVGRQDRALQKKQNRVLPTTSSSSLYSCLHSNQRGQSRELYMHINHNQSDFPVVQATLQSVDWGYTNLLFQIVLMVLPQDINANILEWCERSCCWETMSGVHEVV